MGARRDNPVCNSAPAEIALAALSEKSPRRSGIVMPDWGNTAPGPPRSRSWLRNPAERTKSASGCRRGQKVGKKRQRGSQIIY